MSAAPRRPVHAVPWPLVPVAVLAVAVVAGPPVALLAAVPWPRLGGLLGDAESLTALRLSVTTALLSTVLCVLLGVPLSLWVRDLLLRRPRVARAVQAVVFAPLVLSPVVSGLALVFLWGRRGAESVPTAVLSGGVAGTVGRTFVMTLPGSRGGVRDGIAVLDPLIDHLTALLEGRTAHD
ncbi:hypothetical protein [Corynebacterium bovis]|uniref:hypothetical protein n=1 Tax=Corynebacterium bovis TaxID=36808 RepID=UPI003139F4F9